MFRFAPQCVLAIVLFTFSVMKEEVTMAPKKSGTNYSKHKSHYDLLGFVGTGNETGKQLQICPLMTGMVSEYEVLWGPGFAKFYSQLEWKEEVISDMGQLVQYGTNPPPKQAESRMAWDKLLTECMYLFIFKGTLLGVYGKIYTSMGSVQYFWIEFNIFFKLISQWVPYQMISQGLPWKELVVCLFYVLFACLVVCLLGRLFLSYVFNRMEILGGYNVHKQNGSLLRLVVFMSLCMPAAAVTCQTCFDQVAGCAGGAACIFLTQAAGNLAALAAGAAGIVSVANMLPVHYLKQLPSSVVRTLTVIARRPLNGAPPDVGAMGLPELQDAYDQGTIDSGTLRSELSARLTDPNTAAGVVTRISALINNAANAPAGSTLNLSAGIGGINTVGAISYLVAVASLITKQGATTYSVGASGTVSTGTNSHTIKINTPSSLAGFAELLMVWQTLGHATGAANVLATSRFLQEVVWDAMKFLDLDWQTTYCLFLIYIEAIEHSAGLLHLGNIFTAGGSHDTRQGAARMRRAVLFPVAARPGPAAGEEPPVATAGKKWNDKDSPNASRICHTFNFKDAKHPPKHLYSDGCCKFKHVCMQWVSDKGTAGVCEGNHPKYECKNPNKCASSLP